MQTLDFFWSFIRVVRFLKRLKIYNCQTDKIQKEEKQQQQQQHRNRDVLRVQNLNTASKQSLVKCLYWSSGPACWCCDLLSGHSRTWERKKKRAVEIWNMVEISAHMGRLKDNCCFLLYSHKEETGAHVVRYGTHPNVPVLFEVLRGDHCGHI